MTVKELEEKTGLARANIRYYEQQGLLTPERRENGYRDYGAKDLAVLQKIKLLRYLGLRIETIRAVQRGSCTLTDALAAREADLEKETALLEKQERVCAELRARQIGYAEMDAETYLALLETAERTASAAPVAKQDVVRPLRHPWRRYFARNLDWALYVVLFDLFCTLALHLPWDKSGYQVLNWCAGTALMLLLEPLLLGCFGTTPGKALFGLTLRAPGGGNLTRGQAIRRTYGVFWHGMGLNLPLIGLYFSWRSYQQCMAGQAAPWDENAVYTLKDTRPWRCIAFVLLCALPFLAVMYQSPEESPVPHTGPLTREAFIENVNAAAQLNGENTCRLYLDSSGVWKLTDEALAQVPAAEEVGYGCAMTYEILMDSTQQFVAGVRIFQEGNEGDIFDDLFEQTYLSYLALSLAERPRGGYGRAQRYYQGMATVRSRLFQNSGEMTVGPVSFQTEVVNQGMTFWRHIDEKTQYDYMLDQPLLFDEQGHQIEDPVKDTYYSCTVTLMLSP